MDIQDWSPLGLTGLISVLSKGLSRVFSSTTIQKHQFFGVAPAFFMVQFSHPYMTTGKTIALSIQTFVRNMMPLLLNTLSRSAIAFLPRTKHLLISWLQFTPEHPQKPPLSLAGEGALSMSKIGWQVDHPKTKFWSYQSLFTKWGTLECFQC